MAKTDTLLLYSELKKVTNNVVLRGLQADTAWAHIHVDGVPVGRMLDFSFMVRKTVQDLDTLLSSA